MAREFYNELATVFECEPLLDRPYSVAQYIADRHGRVELYHEIRKLMARTKWVPRETHKLFGCWKKLKTSRGKPLPYPIVITTNFDMVLETTLESAGIPFHLLYYQATGKHKGYFFHRCVDNGLRVLERPENIKSLKPGFVIVKMHGGLPFDKRIPESYSTTQFDYVELAARVPEALPLTIQDRIQHGPILFLGHGMATIDMEVLIRFAHLKYSATRSWAIVRKNAASSTSQFQRAEEYSTVNGVKLLDRDINLYAKEFYSALVESMPESRNRAKSSKKQKRPRK